MISKRIKISNLICLIVKFIIFKFFCWRFFLINLNLEFILVFEFFCVFCLVGWVVLFFLRLVVRLGLVLIFFWVNIRLLICLLFGYIEEKFVVMKDNVYEVDKSVILSIVNKVCLGGVVMKLNRLKKIFISVL